MQHRLFARFLSDQRGVFAVTFGLMAIVLVAMAGAVVDYIQVDQVRTRAQIALDAAALALQPQIYTKSDDELKTTAQLLLSERMSDPHVTAVVDAVNTDTEDGQLLLRAELTVPMAFVSLVGFDEMTTHIISQVTRKKLYVEVAMVLDNSGSMDDYSRMTNLKSAATCATNILFFGTCHPNGTEHKSPNTKIGIVPFTTFVNVGTGNRNASWMDQSGASPVSSMNFDDDDNDNNPYTAVVNRWTLYDQLSDVSWEGCVESRPSPYDTDDTTPEIANPSTLFVPTFAPDESDNDTFSQGWYNYRYYNDYLDDSPSSCYHVRGTCSRSYSYYYGYTYRLSLANGTTLTGGTNVCSCSGGYPCSYSSSSAQGLSVREKQERVCKYSGSVGYLSSDKGPNADCPALPILPLTDSPSTVTTEISNMNANGGTNIQAGAIWGFRTLSPTEPFTQGRDYNTATAKVMIIMTDGQNWSNVMNGNINNNYYYTWYGFMHPDADRTRIGTYNSEDDTSYRSKMNGRTEDVCTNAKAAGITIYTVGLDPPDTATRTMLENCASQSSKAYFPSDPSELDTVFASIAEQLSQLRIER